MTVTITNNLTTLYDAEVTTDWTTDDAVTAYTGFQREGTYCIGMQGSEGTVYAYKTITSVNLTNTIIYSWMNCGLVGTKANGGFRIILGDGTNIRAYYVGGSDDFGFRFGPWSCFVLDTTNLPTNYAQILGTAAPDLTAITNVGCQFYIPIKSVGAGDNAFIDICRYISNSSAALTIGGGTSASPGNFAEIVAEDESTSNAYGIIRELQSGAYGIEGALEFGDSGTLSSYFEDKNAVALFEDHPVPATYYKITLLGNTVGINSVVLGEEVGGVGVSGIYFGRGGTVSYSLDATDPDLNTLRILGSIFQNTGTIDVSSGTIGEFLNVSFNSCKEVQGGTATFDGCIFNKAPDAAFHMIEGNNMGTCSFNSNSIALSLAGITAGSTLVLDNISFTGNSFDLYWDGATGSTLIVQNLNGSNASSQKCPNGGTIDIQTSVNLTVWVDDEGGNPISEVRCAIFTPGMIQLMNELTDANGKAQEVYSYLADQDVSVRIRKQGYIPILQDATITSSGLTLFVTLSSDPAYNPT